MTLFYPNHFWSPQDPLPLPLNLLLCHGIAFKINNPPTWSFQTKKSICRKVLGSPKVAKDLVHSKCHDRHVFLADPAVKMTGFSGCVYCPTHKEAAQLLRPPHLLHLIGLLGLDFSSCLTPFCFVATCIGGFKCVGHST